jgi:hypothetical protein
VSLTHAGQQTASAGFWATTRQEIARRSRCTPTPSKSKLLGLSQRDMHPANKSIHPRKFL